MERFTTLVGIAAPLMDANIDTDAIIPVEQMKAMDADFGKSLFHGRRYAADGTERADFVLNRAPYRKAEILIAGPNFGCGSSREHAVWALVGFGIRCVIAPGFSDIFYNNSFKNGLLPIRLPDETVAGLAAQAAAQDAESPKAFVVDLVECTVAGPDGRTTRFEIDPARREALLEGLDEIGMTLKHENDIRAFQAADAEARPWVYENAFRLGA